jgi:GTP-binding protein
VAINKLDLEPARSAFPALASELERRGRRVAGVSATTRQGLDELLVLLREELNRLPPEAARPATDVRVYRLAPEDEGWTIGREDDVFVVRGKQVERMAAMTDPDSDEGVEQLQRNLGRLGVLSALERAGAQPGSTVKIGPVELDWSE